MYDFLLEMEGLSAAFNDEGSVSLMDKDGKEIYQGCLKKAPFRIGHRDKKGV